jgi:hypothetical protein
LIFGDNTGSSFAGSVTGGAVIDASSIAPKDANPFVSGNPLTPYIPGILGGADVYGQTTLTPSDVALALGGNLPAQDVNGSPLSRAVAAIVRLDVGPTSYGDQFVDHDMLLFVNLSGHALNAPQWGIGGVISPLVERGIANNPTFGGSGPVVVSQLASGNVYATLVPEATTSDLSAAVQDISALAASLGNGDVLYLTVIPEPTTLALSGLGFGILLVAAARRRGKSR